MTLSKVGTAILVAFAVFSAGCSDETAPSPTTGSIRGKVLLGTDLMPVAGAQVTSQPPTSSVLTDSAGEFRIPSVANGSYDLTAQRVGVGSGTVAITVRGGESIEANIIIGDSGPQVELPPVTDGLVVFFPLDNTARVGTGEAFVRSSSMMNTQATDDRKKRQGRATRFLGSSSSYFMADLLPDVQNVPLTISFWLRKDVAPRALETIMSKYLHPSGEGIHLVYESWNFTAAYMTGEFRTYSRVDIEHPKENQWVHIAFVCDDRKCYLYVDGALRGSSLWSTGSSTNTTTTEPFYIGTTRSTAISGSPLEPFRGSIDDLGWYSRALSAQEVIQLSDDR